MKRSIILLAAVCMLIASACAGRGATPQQTASAQIEEADSTLKVQGTCDMCKERIEKAAKGVDGVTFAEWNKETQTLQFRYAAVSTSPEAVSLAIAKTGHDTEKDKADDAVYAALPECCRYR
ncbi:MAG: heavy-metal-associated domain-containing protein [Bacteroidales bacterium]|jgi:copper chaperone CopZ|nr:heavy-metal-associated domain-containing protein [Bacteroidales bacterium]